jgi:hypothetical protein
MERDLVTKKPAGADMHETFFFFFSFFSPFFQISLLFFTTFYQFLIFWLSHLGQ